MSFESIRKLLVCKGSEYADLPPSQKKFTNEPLADALLNDLENFPHAFVLACVMDRQIKAERAWSIPYKIQNQLGTFDFTALARLSERAIRKLMMVPEPLHRFPEIMSHNFHSTIKRIAEEYSGDASKIWSDTPSSATIVCRFLEFDGIGKKIATMAANILVRDFKIPVSDKASIDISIDVHVRRVLRRLGLVSANSSDEELVYTARALNPVFPGVIDYPVWQIGRDWCRPKSPKCSACYLSNDCPKIGVVEIQ